MKTIIHKSEERGQANHGWLKANHSFSFANYFDAEKVQFGALRVFNDDVIAPSMGFGTHPHDNMEIITIPLSGVLKHKDSMHNEWQQVLPGEVQIMSAGSGIQHSEINGSTIEELKLFQIWIQTNQKNVEPRYGQKTFKVEDRKGQLQTLVSGFNHKDEGSLKIHQEAVISRIDLEENEKFTYKLNDERNGVYTMIIEGVASVENNLLSKRDAIGITDANEFKISVKQNSSILFIEVPMF
jgi:redox-sensitive bicupin YhaK (pirin superfamily)